MLSVACCPDAQADFFNVPGEEHASHVPWVIVHTDVRTAVLHPRLLGVSAARKE